ncbi:hypothetical protein [Micromonospora rosaria]|uniref:hypothetical protein n=1 Tax=Micromonospora rosaria TaxID=47874 RepID=UPI0012FC5988|nr:hypothetical protein [Micromonospora rosaria]
MALIHMAIRGVSETVKRDPEGVREAARMVGKGAWKVARWTAGAAAAGVVGDEAARVIRGS